MDPSSKAYTPIEREPFTAYQIYSLFDARARDYRTILIGIMALCGALVVAATNAATDGKPWFVPVAFLVVMSALAGIAWIKIRPELRAAHDRGEEIRLHYCDNSKWVPPIDVNLIQRVPREKLPPQNPNTAEPDTPSDQPLRAR